MQERKAFPHVQDEQAVREEQAVNQVVQVTPLERVNEKIHELTDIVHEHLQDFLTPYGIHLNTVKVLVMPRDERMKALISLKAFGLSELDAVLRILPA